MGRMPAHHFFKGPRLGFREWKKIPETFLRMLLFLSNVEQQRTICFIAQLLRQLHWQ